jgi:signal transduction histidine kinase
LFPAIYRSVQQLMPADVFLIGLINEEGTELDAPFLVENDELLAPRMFALEGSLSHQVIRTKESVFLSNLELSPEQVRFGRSDRHSVAVMFVPLSLGNQVIGVISAQSYHASVYTLHQLGLLLSISRIAAVAINNARLFAREKEVLRSREEFVSLVAHELKNPLAALLGHSQLLERRVRLADEKLRRPVSVIQEQGERMNRLIEDLLDLSRADSGRLTLHMQRTDLASLVRHVVDQQRALTNRHQFVLECTEQLPLIDGDVLRLTQVLQNLLSNAIKYSPHGGTITILLTSRAASDPLWPSRMRKYVEAEARWVLVRVADQGIGIPPDQLGRVFERFYRARNTAQTEVGGTGLGLSVCDGLIKAHGGVIWVESDWGCGSTFSFALPVSAV